MADIYKTSIEAGREARSRGQTGEPPGGDASLGVMADQISDGMNIRGSSAAAPRATAIAPPTTTRSAPVDTTEDILAAISAQPTRDPAEMEAEAQALAAPAEPGIIDSAAKGLKSVKVTWDFLANKLENFVTGDGSTTAPILQKSVEEYKAMASDPRIQEMIQLGNDAPGYYEAGKAMLSYAARNPGLIANFLAEQGAAVVASLPVGGVAGRVAGAAVTRTALSQGVKQATVMGATGAGINSSAVVLGSLGTNYAEGLDKFKGDTNAAADYAATKTLAEVPANAVAGMFLGVNPFSRFAAKSPTAATAGNVGFQTSVQGAGGGLGAVQAAQSVGEEAGKGEILAEIFGEGVLAPIDMYQGRREAKRGLTPPPPPAATPAATTTPTPVTPAPGGIVQDQDFSRLSADEFQSAIESPAFMAAMYSRADAGTRAKLQAANPNLDLAALSQDANLVMDGMKMADNGTGPEFVSMFNQAIADIKESAQAPAPKAATPATDAPFDGGTPVGQGPNDFIPAREKLRMAQELAQEGQMLAAGETITKEQADAIKAQKADPTVKQPTGEEDTPVAAQPSPLARLSQVEQEIRTTPEQVQDGEQITVAWVNTGETNPQVKTGTVKSKGDMKWVEWEEGTLPNGKPTKQRIFLTEDSSAVINPTAQDVEALKTQAEEQQAARAKPKQQQVAPAQLSQAEQNLASQREAERIDDEKRFGEPTLADAINNNKPVYFDSRTTSGVTTYYAKGIGSIEGKYQVQLDLTPEEVRAAKIAEGDISLAENMEEREAARQALNDALLPAAKRRLQKTSSNVATTATPTNKVEATPEAQAQPRFGLPSTISVDDKVYVVEIGPTGKKRGDNSPVHAFVSHKGKVIKIDAQSIIDQFDSEPWTTPKVEGVTALPQDTFSSAEQWLDFVFKHEVGHIGNKKRAGESTGEYENRINEIALVQVKGQDFADSVYQVPDGAFAGAPLETESETAFAKKQLAEQRGELDTVEPPKPEKKKRTKRVKFQEVASETTTTQVQETKAEPKAEPEGKVQQSGQEQNVEQPVVQAPQAQQASAPTVQKVTPKRTEFGPSLEVARANIEARRRTDLGFSEIKDPNEMEPRDLKPQKQAEFTGENPNAKKRGEVVERPEDFVGPTKDRLYEEGAEKQDLTANILEKYPFSMRQRMIDRIRPMSIDEVRNLWSKVSGMKSLTTKFEQAPNQFDDDTGGVMSNLARSGSMGSDAIFELENKERSEAARRAQLEEEVRQSTRAMNTRAKDAAKGITDPELKEIADTQQQEITGTTIDGFINPLGTVGVKPEFNSVAEVTMAEQEAMDTQVDQQAVALQIADAVIKGEMTLGDAKNAARQEGVGTYNLVNALRQLGVDPTPAEINQSGAIAANTTLNAYIRESGYSEYQAREMWLKSYDNLVNKDAVELTKTEQDAYDNWKANRTKYKERLSASVKDNAQYSAGTLEDTFPNALFTQFNLSEMRNPNSIEEPMRSVIKDLFEDPAAAWLSDVATVLSLRPDFEAQVDAILTKEEQEAFQQYRTAELREAFRNAEMIVKSPAYSQLNQLRFLSPEMYAEYQAKIQVAEQRSLAQILHEAAEMNDRAKEAIEAGLTPDNSIDAQMREYMLRDEQMSKPLDEMSDDDGTALYKRGNYSGAVSALAVQEHLTNKFAKWETKPEYTVAQNPNQLPIDVRARLTSRFDNGAFKGALDPKTGHIYLFSDFMENVADAEFTMFHELYGHWGMRAFLGSKMDTFLENQYKLNKEVRETADRLRKEATEMGMPMGKLESIDEAISDIAASGDTSLFRQIVGKLTAWLRANGFDTVAKWMDKSGESELAYVLAGARRSARGQGISPLDGAPSDVRYAANNLPVEVFATRDGKQTGYARINPINGYWTVFVINDINTNDYSAQTVEDYMGVFEILKGVGTVIKAKDRATRVNVDPSDFIDVPDAREITGWRRLARIAQIKAQNMYLPIFEVAEFLNRNGRTNTVIEDLKRYEGKTKYFVDAFENKFQVPIQRLLKTLGDKGASQETIDLYLLARHAEERNKVIKNINPKNNAGSGMSAKSRTLADGTVVPGYIDVLRDSSNAEYSAELEQLGALIDELSKDKVAYMVNTGLITQKQAEALSQYDHYVNLSGNEKLGLDKFDASVLGGRAFNLRGADAKRALGRGTLPVDILQNTMNSYLSTIIRGQKNVPVRAILDMLEANPDPNFAVVEQVKEVKRLNTEKLLADKDILKVIGDAPTEVSGKQFLESLAFRVEDGQITADEGATEIRERIREAEARRDIDSAKADAAIRRINDEVVIAGRLSPDGYVTMMEDPTIQNADNVLVAKVDGKPVRMVFGEKGAEFIQALSGMSMQSRSDTLNAVGAWGRFFSQLVTSWNPAWVPVNGIRDFQTALSNMATDPRVGAGLAKEMAKAWTSSYRTAFRYQVADQANKADGWWGNYLASRSEKHPISAADAAMYEEFRASGAETFFLDRKGLEETIETLNRHMNGPSGVLDWTKGKMEGVGAMMELMTLPMETAPRFAVYKTLRNNGWSVQDASVYAKELTVNFNLKGSSQWIRSLFVFANPSIQGTYRLFQDYSRGEKGIAKLLPSNRFATVMGGWMMLGMLGNFFARGLGGEDDELEGVDKLDQIPHHKRSTSFIIAPDVPGMAMPVGYGINVFFTMGHYLPDIFTGKASADQVAGKVLKTAFDAFAPIGSGAESKTVAGTIMKTITPSIAVPIVELSMNENRFGAPIFKEQSPFSDVKESNAYMHFDSASPISRALMHGLNTATGGTRYKSGLIDVNPAAVDALIGSYLPGLINEAYKGAGLAVRVAQGEDTKRAPIPLVDRLTARVPESWDAGAIRRAKEVVDTAYKEMTAPETTKERRQEIRSQYPGIGAAKAVLAGTDQQIKQIRQQLQAYERDPRKSDDQKVEFRNKMKEAERKIQDRAVQATLKAGFRNEIIND